MANTLAPPASQLHLIIGFALAINCVSFIDAPARSIDSYRLMIGDEIQIESITDSGIRRGDLVAGRGLTIQPDGRSPASLVGQIMLPG